EGSVDLRLSASDASGNTFQQEWLPAVITTGSPAPAAPSQVLATREGATSIRLNWASSSGPAGVREYRIERLPGPQSATVSADTTTFLDTEGLVAGGVYAYRVIAVGNDDAVSTPSGYDVAALVSFQDEPLMPGVTPIRGAHVAELRSAIDVLRQVVSLPPSWMSAGAPSGLVTAADFAAMRDRMNDARTILGLAPAQFSMPFGVGTLIRASHLQELRDALR
ncbi:MAG: fibronectin type III domain-containing protein, partial [Thermoanaerobaculia bacterium]